MPATQAHSDWTVVARDRARFARVAPAVLIVAFAVMGVLAGLGAAPASAHTNLVRVVPGDQSTVTTAPARVRLVFDENVRTPATIVVSGPSGTRVEQGPVRVLDNTASIRVGVEEAGRYTVAFRVVSTDGHPVSAQTSFRFAPGGSARPGSAQPSADAMQAGHGAHAGTDEGGFSSGRVIGIAAGTALLVGLALLTVRRMPGGIVNPSRDQHRNKVSKDEP